MIDGLISFFERQAALPKKRTEKAPRFFSPSTLPALGFLLTLVTVLTLIYGQSFHHPFHYDDIKNIVENRHIQIRDLHLTSIKSALKGPDGKKSSRPLAYFSFGLNHIMGGLNPFGYHLINLIIHSITAFTLFLFIRTMLQLPVLKGEYAPHATLAAIITTLFWACHPIQVTAVTYIVQRMASLSAMFYLISMLFFLKGRLRSLKKKGFDGFMALFFSASFVFGLFAAGTKENAVMLPFSLFLFNQIFFEKENKKRGRPLIYIGAAVALLLWAVFYLSFYTQRDLALTLMDYSYRPYTLYERLLTQPRVLIYYLSMIFFPFSDPFTLLHDVTISRSLLNPITTLLSLFFLFGMLGGVFFMKKKQKVLYFSTLFFFMNHFIEGSFIPLELIYEHRNYLPSLFLFLPLILAVLKGLETSLNTKMIRAGVMGSIIFIFIALCHTTFAYNATFKSEKRLWEESALKSQNLSIVHNNLGRAFWQAGQRTLAGKSFEKAYDLNRYMNLSQQSIVWYNMGLYHLYEKKNYDDALAFFNRSIAQYPFDIMLWKEAAHASLLKGDIEMACSYLKEGLSFKPESVILLHGLSVILFKLGDDPHAEVLAQKVLALIPKAITPFVVFAEILKKRGNYEGAITFWSHVLEKDPTRVKALFALLDLYTRSRHDGKRDEMRRLILALKEKYAMDELRHRATSHPETSVWVPDPDWVHSIIR